MSKENLEQFMSKVADSEELQAKIGEEIDAEALIALGAECGCEFTAEDLQDEVDIWIDAKEDNAKRILAALREFGFGSVNLDIQDFISE